MSFIPQKNFDGLPSLQQQNAAKTCKICGTISHLFDVVDFYKFCSESNPFAFGYSGIGIDYYRCENCEFIFTGAFDDWSSDDFARHIYNADYIKVDPGYDGSRAKDNAEPLSMILGECHDLRILDYGSGMGALEKELSVRGFAHVESYDPFSSPSRPNGQFDIIILMEVIEHTPWPNQDLASIVEFLKPDGIVLVGQTLQPADISRLRGNWWYIAPRNGHISTFSERTFIKMAQQAGLRYLRGGSLYGFARGELNDPLKSVALRFLPIEPVSLLNDSYIHHGRFHGREINTLGDYRWTQDANCSWKVPANPDHYLAVEIPFCNAITADYASQCHVLANGNSVDMQRLERTPGGAFRFDLPPSARPYVITLCMPEPITPRTMWGVEDDRTLGLAILSQAHFGDQR